MTHRGSRYDSASMKNKRLLKNELVHHRRFKTRAEAIQVITEYIEILPAAAQANTFYSISNSIKH